MAITHGCIRMYPEDVAALFPIVPTGTKVWLINDPVKVAYVDGELLLEAHPPVDKEGQKVDPNREVLAKLLDQALGDSTVAIDWDLAGETLQAAKGVPTLVGLQADLDGEPSPGGTQVGDTGSSQHGGGSSRPAMPAAPAAPQPLPALPVLIAPAPRLTNGPWADARSGGSRAQAADSSCRGTDPIAESIGRAAPGDQVMLTGTTADAGLVNEVRDCSTTSIPGDDDGQLL
jgi:hypothetical protein